MFHSATVPCCAEEIVVAMAPSKISTRTRALQSSSPDFPIFEREFFIPEPSGREDRTPVSAIDRTPSRERRANVRVNDAKRPGLPIFAIDDVFPIELVASRDGEAQSLGPLPCVCASTLILSSSRSPTHSDSAESRHLSRLTTTRGRAFPVLS